MAHAPTSWPAGFGAFGGAFAHPARATRDPVLVASVDGVGTKLHLAIEWGRPEVAGRDLVNHGINDVGVLARDPGRVPRLRRRATASTRRPCSRSWPAWPRPAGRPASRSSAARPPTCPARIATARYDLAGCMLGVVERSRAARSGARRASATSSSACRRSACTRTATASRAGWPMRSGPTTPWGTARSPTRCSHRTPPTWPSSRTAFAIARRP